MFILGGLSKLDVVLLYLMYAFRAVEQKNEMMKLHYGALNDIYFIMFVCIFHCIGEYHKLQDRHEIKN